MDKLKISFIGAGSGCFAQGAFTDILLSDPLNEFDLELVLMDIEAGHLTENEGFAKNLAEQLNRKPTIRTTTDLDDAVEGARIVVSAIEVERYKYWAQDFHIPRKYGSLQIYGENGGPGGIFHALRSMGPTIDIARAIERLSPDAVLINFANPESKLCEAIDRLTSIECIGLCHGVFMGQEQIAAFLERPKEELATAACGFNHYTWFQKVEDKETGEDLYPLLREKELEADILGDWDDICLGRILLRTYGLYPSPATNHYGEYFLWAKDFLLTPNIQYFYDAERGTDWDNGKTPQLIYSLGRHFSNRPLFDRSKPDKEGSGSEKQHHTPTEELTVPIIEGLVCDIEHHLDAIIYPNRGSIPGISDDMTVEMPATINKDGVRPHQMEELPEGIAAVVRQQGSIQKLIVEAFAEKSRQKLLHALLLDPTTTSYSGTVATINEMLELQGDLLPEFT